MVLIESNDPWNAYLMLFRYVKRDEIGGTSSQLASTEIQKQLRVIFNESSRYIPSRTISLTFFINGFEEATKGLHHAKICVLSQKYWLVIIWKKFVQSLIQKSFISLKIWTYNKTILFIKMLIDNELFILWYAH